MAMVLYFVVIVFIEIVNVSRAFALDEDLENMLLSLHECVGRIDRNEFPGNINFLEHLRDRLEGYNRIIMAISLVLSNPQVAIMPLIANLLSLLREKLQGLRSQINVSSDQMARRCRMPALEAGEVTQLQRSKSKYYAVQVWIGHCPLFRCVSPKTLYRKRRMEYGIVSTYSDIT